MENIASTIFDHVYPQSQDGDSVLQDVSDDPQIPYFRHKADIQDKMLPCVSLRQLYHEDLSQVLKD